MPNPCSLTTALILSCVPGYNIDEEKFDYDIGIQLDVNDFIVVPVGTSIQMYDGEECLFDDGEIESYFYSNRYGGLFVEMVITQHSWEKMYGQSIVQKGYTSRKYPRTLSMTKS